MNYRSRALALFVPFSMVFAVGAASARETSDISDSAAFGFDPLPGPPPDDPDPGPGFDPDPGTFDPTPDNPIPRRPESVTPEAIEMLIGLYDLTEEEAREQISLQQEIVGLRESLVNDGTFAGIWVERNPYTVRVAFTSDAEKRTEALKRAFSKPEAVVATGADFSQADLAEAAQRIQAAVESSSDDGLRQLSGLDVYVRVRTTLNEVEVITPFFATVKGATDNAFPAGLVRVVEGPAVEVTPDAWIARGGEAIASCTTGYVVRKDNSTDSGVTTAEHCSTNGRTYNGHPVEDRLQEYNDADGDVVWLSLRDRNWDPRNEIDTDSGSDDVVGTVSYWALDETDVVCKHGRTTGTTCGEVLSKTGAAGRFIEATYWSEGGDSGSPVWMDIVSGGVHAVSTHSGRAGPVPWYQNPEGDWVDTVAISGSISFWDTRWDVKPATSTLPAPGFDWFLINHHPADWAVADDEWEYGESGWQTVAGDWVGVGHDQPGNFLNGFWNLEGVGRFQYGTAGDLPVVGDWDQDGIDEVGVYRPSNETFYKRGSTSVQFSLAVPGDIAVAGNWDNFGKDNIGIFRPSSGLWIQRWDSGIFKTFYYGIPNDNPVTGDWNNNGQDTVGVVRPNGLWLLRNSNTQGFAEEDFWFGNPGDRFLAGDWDGLSFDTAGLTR